MIGISEILYLFLQFRLYIFLLLSNFHDNIQFDTQLE